ncbi:MAG: class I SAM-dependent methyltransferase [bacterium]|nr:class I SAM-dependent methyltransferase [bacterium]MDA1292320.1 class I SAM-dependent methyltransferase [bacterium]
MKKHNTSVSYPVDGTVFFRSVEDDSYWFQHRANVLLDLFQQYPPSEPMYDIGGGNGYFAFTAQRAGVESVLVEPDIQGGKYARERGVRSIIQSRFEDADIQQSSMGSVCLLDVLEHIDNDEEFLTCLHRGLKPNGKLYITVPAMRWLWSYEDLRAGHKRRYTLLSLQDVLERAGFSIDYATYFFSMLPLPIMSLRTIPSVFGWKPKAKQEDYLSKNIMLKKMLQNERRKICAGSRISFGSSCLIVATAIR